MSTDDCTYVVRFPSSEYRFHIDPIELKFDASPLEELIEQSRQGYRIYELMSIRRSYDVWKYVDAIPVTLPSWLAPRVRSAIKIRESARDENVGPRKFPELSYLSVAEFDELFDRRFYHDMPQWRNERFGHTD